MEIPLDLFEHQIFFATLRVETFVPGISGANIGTGFLVLAPLDSTQSLLLLISNKHVFADPGGMMRLRLHSKDPQANAPLLGSTVTVGPWQFSEAYYRHPNPDVDLACVNLSALYTANSERVYLRHIGIETFATYDEPDLAAGQRVIFVGYPDNRYDETNNLPILRAGVLASYPHADFCGLPQVVIDAQVFEGSSGSPVFMGLGNKYKLIGVVVQTMARQDRLIAAAARIPEYSRQMLGLGLVYKSTAVRDLIAETLKIHKERNPQS